MLERMARANQRKAEEKQSCEDKGTAVRQDKPCIRQSFMQLYLKIMESSRDALVEEELDDRSEENQII